MTKKSKVSVGCVALSSPCHPEMIKNASEFFEGIGVEVSMKLSPCQFYGKDDHLFSSDSARNRVRALTELAEDPKVDFIFTARGGSGALELLPLLDFEHLKNFRKPLVGFSDATALLIALQQDADWPCVHGSVFGSFNRKEERVLEAEWHDLLELLRGDSKVLLGAHSLELLAGQHEADIQGKLVGGNLSLLASLMGSPWSPNLSNAILFFEEVGEPPYRLHRMLLQLGLAAGFSAVKAVVVGDLKGCEHAQGKGPGALSVITRFFEPFHIPVFSAPFFGHGETNFPIPLGVQAKISLSKQLELV